MPIMNTLVNTLRCHQQKTDWIAKFILLVLILFTAYLAVNRIIQVDEAQNVFMARVVGAGQTNNFYTNGSLILLGPLSWLANSLSSSEGIYIGARLLAWGLYWGNLAILGWICSNGRSGSQFLWTLVVVATLVPMVDYGFEIRHDNLVLTLILIIWLILRFSKISSFLGFATIGFLSGILQFLAFKSFLYWAPIAIASTIFPPPKFRGRCTVRIGGFLLGALTAAVLARLAYDITGSWGSFVAGLRAALGATASAVRFSPWISIRRLLDQAPLMVVLYTALAVKLGLSIKERGLSALGWAGSGPEAMLALLATGAFTINPTPYPYNLVNLVPFLVMFIFRGVGPWGANLLAGGCTAHHIPLVFSMVVIAHAVPFVRHTSRHLEMDNKRQTLLMRTAETLTDPNCDRVFDAAGLVPTRQSIGYQWFLHTLIMDKFNDGRLPPIREQLALQSASVLLFNYRTDWLSTKDHAFIRENYIALADDLAVLGQVLPNGGGIFHCLHQGRYIIRNLDSITNPPELDGQKLIGNTPVILAQGNHVIKTGNNTRTLVAWVGPKLKTLPSIPDGDHGRLFVNWY